MAQMDDFDDLDDLGSLDDFEDLDDLEGLTLEDDPPAPQAPAAPAAAPIAAPPPAAAAPTPAAPLSGLGTVIQDLMAKRNFAQVVQIASSQKDAITQDPQALAMVQTAQRQLEADNYVQSFLQAAGAARDRGDVQGMQEQLEKARALDPQHPAIAAFSTAVAAAAAPAAAPIAAPPPAAAPAPAAPQATAAAAPQAAVPAAPQAPAPAAPAPAEDDFLSFDDDAPLELGAPAVDPAPATPAPNLGADLSIEEPLEDAGHLDMSFEEPTAAPAAAAPPVPEAPPAADAGDAEGGDRIQQLLTEGQAQFDDGDYQGAIDVWSRIFLIDIDNSEASRLIEEARGRKAELERQAEEFFHQGSDHVEQRQMEEAKAAFQQVLEIDPSHSLAREYLDQLEAGEYPVLNRGGDAEILTPPEDGEGFAGEEGHQSMEAAVQRDRIVVTKKMDRRLIALGALVAIVLIGGGVFLAMNWNDLPPNQQEVATAPAMKTDPIEKATKLHEEGKTDAAIRVLELIPEASPVYQDANALVAQWRAEAEAPPEDIETGPSQEQLARRQLLLGAARSAHGEGLHLRARKYFDAATAILPLEGEDAALANVGRDALASLAKEIELFEEAEYERLIPELWRRRDREPDNADVELLLVDSYYNLALTDLQRGDALGAADKLKDALTVQPENRELQRLELFAKTYSSRSADLLYRIYVKYLPSRS